MQGPKDCSLKRENISKAIIVCHAQTIVEYKTGVLSRTLRVLHHPSAMQARTATDGVRCVGDSETPAATRNYRPHTVLGVTIALVVRRQRLGCSCCCSCCCVVYGHELQARDTPQRQPASIVSIVSYLLFIIIVVIFVFLLKRKFFRKYRIIIDLPVNALLYLCN